MSDLNTKIDPSGLQANDGNAGAATGDGAGNASQGQATASTAAALVSGTQPGVALGGTTQQAANAIPPAAGATSELQDAQLQLQPDASTDSEEVTLLRGIKADIGVLSTKIDDAQRLAVRNGAIAGGVAGGVSGGIVAVGVSFIRAKLGF